MLRCYRLDSGIHTSSLFPLTYYFISAGVAELADALDSDSNGSNTMWVQVPFSAPNGINPNLFIVGDGFGFILFCEYPNSNGKMK